MNILADENVAHPIVERLRKEGHEVEYIFDIARGSVDIDILERANRFAIAQNRKLSQRTEQMDLRSL